MFLKPKAGLAKLRRLSGGDLLGLKRIQLFLYLTYWQHSI